MREFKETKEYTPSRENCQKLKSIFSENSVFLLAFLLIGMTVLIFLKTMVSVFGAVRLDELYWIYDITGFGNMQTGLVNLFAGGIATTVMCIPAVNLLCMISSANKENFDRLRKLAGFARAVITVAFYFTMIMITISLVSVGTIDRYYSTAAKFYGSDTGNIARTLAIRTVMYGMTALVAESIFARFISGIEFMLSDYERDDWNFVKLVCIVIGGLFAAKECLFFVVDMFMFDYKTVQDSPEKFAMLVIDLFLTAALTALVVFLLWSFVCYLLPKWSDDCFYEEFYEENEEFESRVFSQEPLHYGQTEGYKLTFEIPHTEYPNLQEGGAEIDG